MKVSQFNLLDEPWISVIYDEKGKAKEVSLKDLFENAHLYKELAGDTRTQDFAVLRVLLAVLHTVFSRFDVQGRVYDYLEVDEKFSQIKPVDTQDTNDYIEKLHSTWGVLWKSKKFPNIVNQYLEKWRARFYLFDEEYPFYQVRREDIASDKISKSKASVISGKNINRTISESNNKIALFSPKSDKTKEMITSSELVRWLITFQGYSGLSDKVIFGEEKYKVSKGWLFDIGAIYIKGNNLFETLLLNCILLHAEYRNLESIQKPCWELSSSQLIDEYLSNQECTNLAALYTNWSRAIYIHPATDLAKPFSFEIVKLPEINHRNNSLEPMTIWKNHLVGEYKGSYTPKKHILDQSLWRSFGLLVLEEDKRDRIPGIISWMRKLEKIVGDQNFTIVAISMQDDGNATSWVPTNEIIDTLSINELVLSDLQEDGWVLRINETVEITKEVISSIFKRFIEDIKEIRNITNTSYSSQKIEMLYFKIDQPFRKWLSNITIEDEKDPKVREWKNLLQQMVRDEAQLLLKQGGTRDYLGIEKEGNIKNIATAYNRLERDLYRKLNKKG